MGPDRIRESFQDEYRRVFGHELDEELEIVTLRAAVRTPLPGLGRWSSDDPGPTNGSGNGTHAEISAYSFRAGTEQRFAVVPRHEVLARVVRGPAILHEATTTTYLDVGFEARADESGALLLSRSAR